MTVAARTLGYIRDCSGRAMSDEVNLVAATMMPLLIDPKFRCARKIALTGNRKNDFVLLATGHVDDLPKSLKQDPQPRMLERREFKNKESETLSKLDFCGVLYVR